MKTNELFSRLEEYYEVGKIEKIGLGYSEIKADDRYGNTLFTVFGDVEYFIDANYKAFRELEYTTRIILWGILTDYASTPVEDRQEEEKFYYRLPGLDDGVSYINLVDGSILKLANNLQMHSHKTRFTQSDIYALTEEQQKLFEIAYKERVK